MVKIRGKVWALIIGLVLIALGILLFALPYIIKKPAANNNESCLSDSDCVPASCCHAASCMNKNYAPACEDAKILCTMSCDTILDCGQGSCKCVNKKCEAVSN